MQKGIKNEVSISAKFGIRADTIELFKSATKWLRLKVTMDLKLTLITGGIGSYFKRD